MHIPNDPAVTVETLKYKVPKHREPKPRHITILGRNGDYWQAKSEPLKNRYTLPAKHYRSMGRIDGTNDAGGLSVMPLEPEDDSYPLYPGNYTAYLAGGGKHYYTVTGSGTSLYLEVRFSQ